MKCEECAYLQVERAAIHEFDGVASRVEADKMAANERCEQHTIGGGEKRRYPRAAALEVARELCAALKPVTERMIVAGSMRRRKEAVGDVEIVFVPKVEMREDAGDMFKKRVEVDLAEAAINELVGEGVLRQRPKRDGTFTWGAENKLAVHVKSEIPVDFFAARPVNWGNLVVCRTGSKESNERICKAAIERGWRWNPYGAGFHDRLTGKLVRTVRTEQEVFTAVGLPYREPWER